MQCGAGSVGSEDRRGQTLRRRRSRCQGLTGRPLAYKAIEAQFGWVRTYSCMPATCEYAFVTVRHYAP